MKCVFLGSRHRVQFRIHVDPDDQHVRRFEVDALPRSAHRSTAYISGQQLYRGTSAGDAWESVLELVPSAQAPASLRAALWSGGSGIPICPICGTMVRAQHRRTEITWPRGHARAESWLAHSACVAGQPMVDPKLLSS